MNSISTPDPSLSSRAMLCSLSISMWSARKHDREASEEIAQRHGAQADAGRYHKVLLPKEALAEIHKIVSEARQEHYFMTCPGTITAIVSFRQPPTWTTPRRCGRYRAGSPPPSKPWCTSSVSLSRRPRYGSVACSGRGLSGSRRTPLQVLLRDQGNAPSGRG